MSDRRVAVVTGGTRGIGYGIAEALAREEWDLLLCGRRSEGEVREAVVGLRDLGSDVRYVAANVGSAEDRGRLLDAARSHFGRLDLLVNNAGMAPRRRMDLLAASEESFDEVIAVNLKGPYFLMQAAAQWMIEQQDADAGFRSAIVNVGSISATMASVNRGEYCISKAGLAMATQLWAVRLGEYDIPVYEVRPGVVRSDMTAGVREKYDHRIEEGLMVQARWGEPGDVGRAVAMLARGDLPYSTGQVVMVDGGITLSRL